MSITEAKARALIPTVLRHTAETLEDPRIAYQFKQSEGWLALLVVGRPFTEKTTKETFYPLVYVVVAETSEEIDRHVESLLPPGAA